MEDNMLGIVMKKLSAEYTTAVPIQSFNATLIWLIM